MPEGPEVQRVVDQLAKLKNLRLTQLWIPDQRWMGKRKKLNLLLNCKLADLQRKAKYIIFTFHDDKTNDNMYLINHLSMSGGWLYRAPNARMIVHTRLSFLFTAEGVSEQVDFVDPRKFGRLEFYSSADFWGTKVQTKLGNLGPDTLFDEITYQTLVDQIHKLTEHQPDWEIKPLLMEQTFLAGIGNIYSSEICFLAGISPFKKAAELTVEELKNLEEAIPVVMKKAYESGGSTISTYKAPNGKPGWTEHMVYNMKYCRLCKSQISKGPQAGRTTHWCPKCQPM